MKSQVTTKQGDAGNTVALSGDSWPKSHIIIECVGAVDELRAYTALARVHLLEQKPDGYEAMAGTLLWLLHVYFLVGSACSDPRNKHPERRKGDVGPKELARLEQEQQRLEAATPLPHAFIVSAATPLAAHVDVACVAARRLERNLVRLKETVPEFDASNLLAFINRLSDFLYILARHLEGPRHLAVDYDVLD